MNYAYLAIPTFTFQLTCSKRKIDSDHSSQDWNIIDAYLPMPEEKEDVITCNGEPMSLEKNSYVYDYYYADSNWDFDSKIDLQ